MKGIGGSNAVEQLATITPWATPAAPITQDERLARIEKARRLTRDSGADALLIAAGTSLRYFAGVPWGGTERLVAMLIPVTGDPVMIAPHFELGSLQAEMQISTDYRLWQEDQSPTALVADMCRGWGADTLAIDPALPFLFVDRIARDAPALTLVSGAPAIDGCRMHKSPAEIALMQQAKTMTLEIHRRAALILREGIRASEVVRFIDEGHRKIGGAPSTFCMVQFGHGTAFPHGVPGDPQLREGDMVLI
ncbi:MAG: M24 family metallopeptidase, partial [Blastomonas fulva]